MKENSLNVLFVCSMNQWRSPTAEKVYQDRPFLNTRSRGTSHRAKKTVSSSDLKWADIIFVMEQKHSKRLLSQFPGEMRYRKIHVLDIPDEYQFMDPELVVEIENAVDPLLAAKLPPTFPPDSENPEA